MSSSSSVPSKKPVNKKTATPVRGPFGLMYNPDGSVHRDNYPRIVRPTDYGSPPSVHPPTPNTIPKSFDKQKGAQMLADNEAHLAIATLTDEDPTGIIEGDSATDPTTMEELVTALQSTAHSAYSKKEILAALQAKQSKLQDNFLQRALDDADELPPLPVLSRHGYGPMDASHERPNILKGVPVESAKRSYQPTPLELVGSSQSKRQASVSVSAATVAFQVGVSSSVPAKLRNPGQRQIIPAKRLGEYHGSDKILQYATAIPPSALDISITKWTSSKTSESSAVPIPVISTSQPTNHFDAYVAERAAASRETAVTSSVPLIVSTPSYDLDPAAADRLRSTRLRSARLRSGLSPDDDDGDSLPSSSSSSDHSLQGDNAVHDNDLPEEPVVTRGVHSDLFENCFSMRMSASNFIYRAPGSIVSSDSGQVFGPILVNFLVSAFGRNW